MLMLEGFQAGLSWSVILHKREAFRKAFANFDPAKVARFGERDILRVVAHIDALGEKNNVFGDVGCVIPDPFQVSGDEDEINGGGHQG